jgi:nucleoid-associated protein YgaU
MKQFENSVMKGWNKKKKKWFPHISVEGGKKTIAYGHKLTASEDFKDGITDTEATKLLLADIEKAQTKIKTILGIDIDKLPRYVQQALINAMFRGELKSTHDTVDLMKQDKWQEAAAEYINHNDYKNGPPGVKKRMQWNYDKFKYYADSLKVYIVQSGDTLSSIAAKQPKGITAKTIALANNIDLDNPIIYPGQKLKIK